MKKIILYTLKINVDANNQCLKPSLYLRLVLAVLAAVGIISCSTGPHSPTYYSADMAAESGAAAQSQQASQSAATMISGVH